MLGGATQAMPLCIVEERQQRRRPLAAAPLRAAARRPAGCVARSLHTAPGMLVARALPAGLGACSKVQMLFCDGPLARGERFLRTPGTRAYATNAPRQGCGELLQPLPGCVSLFFLYPGVRFAHPRLISFRPAGAEYVIVCMKRDSRIAPVFSLLVAFSR